MISNYELHVNPDTAKALSGALTERFGALITDVEQDAGLIREEAGLLIASHLEEKLLHGLSQFRKGGLSHLVIRGFETDRFIGATPPFGKKAPGAVPQTTALQLGLQTHCGMLPLGYSFENEGDIFRAVVPAIGSQGTKSSHGSSVTFPWHTDNPSGTPYPDTLCFVGLRNHEGVPTEVLQLDRVIASLGDEALETLQRQIFRHVPPVSNTADAPPLQNAPVLWRSGGVWRVRYDRESTFPMPDAGLEAAAALSAFRIALLDAEAMDGAEEIILERGDFLIFRNDRVLHRRKAFQPHEDFSKRRWLSRVYGLADHSAWRHPEPYTRPYVVDGHPV